MSKIVRIDSLHFGDYTKCSSNGDGIRIIIWFSGCDIRCRGCHNSDFWDFDNPNFEDFSKKHIDIIINEMSKYSKIYSGLSILGGEPFSLKNIDDVLYLCERFKKEFPNKNIWIWSGHTLEWLDDQTDDEYYWKIHYVLDLCDYLVDGPFDITKRNISLKFRGSSNQIIWEKSKNDEWIKSELNN